MANQKCPIMKPYAPPLPEEKWAVAKVVECYQDGINKQATVRKRQPDGTVKEVIDEDMRRHITMKLIEALPTFPLEELEKQSREIGQKKEQDAESQ